MLITLSLVTVFSTNISAVAQDTFFEAAIDNATSSNITELAKILPSAGEPSTDAGSQESTSGGGLPFIGNQINDNGNRTTSSGLTDLTANLGDYIDKSIQDYNQQANAIKAKIESSSFTPGDGEVIELINSIAYLRGQVEVLGAGYPVLHSTEQALIDKINEVGPSAFSQSEQSYITTWVNDLKLEQEEEKRYATVLPGFK